MLSLVFLSVGILPGRGIDFVIKIVKIVTLDPVPGDFQIAPGLNENISHPQPPKVFTKSRRICYI